MDGFHFFRLVLWKGFVSADDCYMNMYWPLAVSFQKLYDKCNCICFFWLSPCFPLTSNIKQCIWPPCFCAGNYYWISLPQRKCISCFWHELLQHGNFAEMKNIPLVPQTINLRMSNLNKTNAGLFSSLNFVSELNEVRKIACQWDVWMLFILSAFGFHFKTFSIVVSHSNVFQPTMKLCHYYFSLYMKRASWRFPHK